jgi:hypothetical protein
LEFVVEDPGVGNAPAAPESPAIVPFRPLKRDGFEYATVGS